MSDKEPKAGETYYDSEGEDFEIAEVVGQPEPGVFSVVDEDGEDANIKWSTEADRWEVDV